MYLQAILNMGMEKIDDEIILNDNKILNNFNILRRETLKECRSIIFNYSNLINDEKDKDRRRTIQRRTSKAMDYLNKNREILKGYKKLNRDQMLQKIREYSYYINNRGNMGNFRNYEYKGQYKGGKNEEN